MSSSPSSNNHHDRTGDDASESIRAELEREVQMVESGDPASDRDGLPPVPVPDQDHACQWSQCQELETRQAEPEEGRSWHPDSDGPVPGRHDLVTPSPWQVAAHWQPEGPRVSLPGPVPVPVPVAVAMALATTPHSGCLPVWQPQAENVPLGVSQALRVGGPTVTVPQADLEALAALTGTQYVNQIEPMTCREPRASEPMRLPLHNREFAPFGTVWILCVYLPTG